MRRLALYFAVALLAFGVGSIVVIVKTKNSENSVEEKSAKYEKHINETINQIEFENKGFDELLNAKNGEIISVQGFFDQKFLCLDVTNSEPNICTTVLIGSSNENKSLLIRLPVCNEQNKSNCIVWKPDNICSDGESCSNVIRIYDNNSKITDLIETIKLKDGGKSYFDKSDKIKVTGKISFIEGKYYIKSPIEKIELTDLE